MNVLWISASGFLILVGLVGAVLPILPGPPVALAGLILFGLITDFEKVSVTAIAVFSALTILTILFDLFGPALVAKGYKATAYGAWGAVIGAILGIMILGPIGAFLGPFMGAFIGEIISPKAKMDNALRSAWGAFVGFLVGTLFKLAITIAMAAYFVVSLFK